MPKPGMIFPQLNTSLTYAMELVVVFCLVHFSSQNRKVPIRGHSPIFVVAGHCPLLGWIQKQFCNTPGFRIMAVSSISGFF